MCIRDSYIGSTRLLIDDFASLPVNASTALTLGNIDGLLAPGKQGGGTTFLFAGFGVSVTLPPLTKGGDVVFNLRTLVVEFVLCRIDDDHAVSDSFRDVLGGGDVYKRQVLDELCKAFQP